MNIVIIRNFGCVVKPTAVIAHAPSCPTIIRSAIDVSCVSVSSTNDGPAIRSTSFINRPRVNPGGSAVCFFDGLDGDETEALAKSMEEERGITFTVSSEDGCLKIAASGENGHASTPWKGKNALTGLLALIERLPLAECGQLKAVRALNHLMPHGDWFGAGLGIQISDEESGELTLAFSMLDISEKSLEGEFDSRCPICATKENTIDVIRKNMEAEGISFNTEELEPPHHVPADSDFVKTLLSAYESYSGRKGECIAIGGGTYVHHLKNGVAFGACLPETENHMHGPDEFAVVDELLMSAKIFAQVIVDLCS